MRKIVSWALAMTFLLGFAQLCLAQKPQPVVTISFSGYDELMKDVEMFGKLRNMPELGKMFEDRVQKDQVGKVLFSLLDKSKPWGAVLSMTADNPEPTLQMVLPLTDINPVVKFMGERGAAPRDLGGGIYETQVGPRTLAFQQKGGWTLVASAKQGLDDIPSDPASLLGGLNQKYAVAVSIAVKNIPPQIREQAIFWARMMLQMRAPGGAAVDQAMNQFSEMLNGLDTVVIGLAIDRSANAARLDVVSTVQPGSKMAQRLAQMGEVKTDMAGLADPSAAVVFTITQKLADDEIAQMKAHVAAMRRRLEAGISQNVPPDDAKLARQVLDHVMGALTKTVEGGKIDAGLMASLAPKNAQLVAGAKIADGAKLNEAIKLIVARASQMAPQMVQMLNLKLDAETYQGVHFHLVSPPMAVIQEPRVQEIVSKLFGDKVELALGIGEDCAYFAVSSDAAKTLKGVIDKSKASAGNSTPPVQVSVAATPVARVFSDIYIARGGPAQAADRVQQILSPAGAKDHFKLTVTVNPNGSKLQLDLEEGILRLMPPHAGRGSRPMP